MIIGNLGAEPEMKYTPSGSPFTTFRVAVGRTWRTREGENRDETEWFRVVAWDKLAEVCSEYLHKGSKVYIEGRLQTRSWDKDGQKQYMTELIASDMQMLDSRADAPREGAPRSSGSGGGGGGGNSYGGGGGGSNDDYDTLDDDIPF